MFQPAKHYVYIHCSHYLSSKWLKSLTVNGWFHEISIPYHGRHLHQDPPPCLRKFQNVQSPLALVIPKRFTPPCLRNSVIIQTPLRNFCFSFQLFWEALSNFQTPLFIIFSPANDQWKDLIELTSLTSLKRKTKLKLFLPAKLHEAWK